MTIQASPIRFDALASLTPPKAVVFIDAGVEQPDALAQGVIPGAEVYLIDRDADAIAQITQVLSDRTDLGAVHILSHGAPGRLLLGNGELSLSNLTAHSPQLSRWFAGSRPHQPELLLYGCSVAAGDAGAAFIAQLQAITGATLSAASHTVGAAAQGGQWRLDQGKHTAPLALTSQAREQYAGAFPVNLEAGDLAVVAYGSDPTASTDRFSLVALADIAAGSVIFLTDNGWNSTTNEIGTGESILSLIVGSSGIDAGSVITNANIGTFGSVSGISPNFSDSSGDQLLIYQTDNDQNRGTPTAIYAFNNSLTENDTAGWQSTSDSQFTSGVPDGTTAVATSGDGNTAFGLLGEVDNAFYQGPVSGTKATLLAAISDVQNWTSSDDAIPFENAPTAFGVSDESDSPGFTVSRTDGLVTPEDSGTDSFTVQLNAQPSEDVVLTLKSSDESEAMVSGPLTFTPQNWFSPQTVTLTGVNDNFVGGDGFYTITADSISAGADYANVDFPTVSGTTPDDDEAGFNITNIQGEFAPDTTIPVITEAGGTYSFDISLKSEPLEDVTLDFVSSDTGEGTVTSQVMFQAADGATPSNWDQPQTVTLTGVDDFILDGDVDFEITATVTSTDANYSGITPPNPVTARNLDNDQPGVTLSDISGDTTEANTGTATFDVVLDSQPTADVTLTFTSSDTTEGTVTEQVVFTSENWNSSQQVTVTGIDDSEIDGDITYSIGVSSQSNDVAYNALADIGTVSVTNLNDDVVGPKDFNGDNSKDLLWVNNSTGALAYWSILEVNNTPTSRQSAFLNADLTQGRDVIGTVDFNKDGKSDILVRDNGQDVNQILLMDGTQQTAAITIGANKTVGNTNWRMRAAGNFDSDDDVEILWRNIETGGFALWNLDENNEATSTFVDVSALGLGASGVLSNLSWEIQASGDVDGDGRDEIFWRNTENGGNAIWSMNDSGGVEESVFTTQLGALAWDMMEVADYTNDGVIDIAWRNATTGQNAIWTMAQSSNGLSRASSDFIPSLSAPNWSAPNQQAGEIPAFS